MAMANMNLIGVFVTKLWPVQVLACGGGRYGGGATKNIISQKFSNFGDIIVSPVRMYVRGILWFSRRYAASTAAASADIIVLMIT